MRLTEAIEHLTQQLAAYSESARLDAELLMSAVLGQSREQLWIHPEWALSLAQEKKLQEYIKRRQSGEPMAYLLGHKEFWSLDLTVTPDVLIPRPETEMLVEWALQQWTQEASLLLADLGTGSGAVALAVAYERLHWHIDATDVSEAALLVARSNVERYSLSNVQFYCGAWCHALPRNDYHVILGNPPYIPEGDECLSHLSYEPRQALVAGSTGLEAIEKIMEEAKSYLLPGGWLVLEHGSEQSVAIMQRMKRQGYQQIQDFSDLAGLPRMVIGHV